MKLNVASSFSDAKIIPRNFLKLLQVVEFKIPFDEDTFLTYSVKIRRNYFGDDYRQYSEDVNKKDFFESISKLNSQFKKDYIFAIESYMDYNLKEYAIPNAHYDTIIVAGVPTKEYGYEQKDVIVEFKVLSNEVFL